MQKPGRNELCHCGSGKKYKRCHLDVERGSNEGPRTDAQELHDRESALVMRILEWSTKDFGKSWVKKTLEGLLGEAALTEDGAPFFLAWLAWHAEKNGISAGAAFRKAEATRLDADTLALLESQLGSWLTVWRVRSVRPEVGMDLEDVLTGRTSSVRERLATRGARVGVLLLGRVLELDGLSIFAGLHTNALPGGFAADIAGEMTAISEKHGFDASSPDHLRSDLATSALISLWEGLVAELADAGPPRLVNREGEEVLLTTDRFDLSPAGDRDHVVKKLMTIPGAHRARTAAKSAARVVFERNDSLVGSAVVRDHGLVVEAMAVTWADALRAEIEEACGSLVRHRIRHHVDPLSDAAFEDSADDVPPPLPDPEVSARLRQYKEKYYRDWLNEQIPALGGITPRAAVRTAAGRKRVEQLVGDIERGEAELDEEDRYDVAILREALGLAPATAPATAGRASPPAAPIDSAPASFNGVYVVRTGPVAKDGKKLADAYLPVLPDGRADRPEIETSAARALAAIARRVRPGTRLGCTPDLEKAGKKHGFAAAPTPRTAFELLLSFSMTVALPPDVDMLNLPPQAAVDFGSLARALYLAAPWRHWSGDDPVDVVLRTPDGESERCTASILGELGQVLGFALYESAMFEAIRDERVDASNASGLSLTLDSEPEAPARAFEAAFGIPFFPSPLRMDRGALGAPDGNDLLRLLAVGRALAQLTPSARTARGEVVLDGGRVVADVTAQPLVRKTQTRPRPTPRPRAR